MHTRRSNEKQSGLSSELDIQYLNIFPSTSKLCLRVTLTRSRRGFLQHRYWSSQVAIVSKLKPVAEPIFGFPDGTEFDAAEGRERESLRLIKNRFVAHS